MRRPAARVLLAARRAAASRMTPHSSGSLLGVERRHLARASRTRAPLCTQQRRVAAVVDDQDRARAVGPHRAPRWCTTSTPRASRPSRRTPACRCGVGRACRRLGPAHHHRGRRVVLRREDVARHPAHVGAERRQRLDEHRRLDGHVQAAHDARPRRAAARRRSCSRSAIRPGISCSARRISLRPYSASERSFTLYGSRPAAGRGSNGCSVRRSRLSCAHSFSLNVLHAGSLVSVSGTAAPGRGLTCGCGRAEASRPRRSPRRAVAANSVGPFAAGSAGSGARCDAGRSRPGEPGRDAARSEKPSQTWPICCRYSSRSCGSMSTTSSRPPGLRTRAASRQRHAGLRHVVQDQHDHRGVELAVGDRQGLQRRRAAARRCRGPPRRCAPPSSIAGEPSTAMTRRTNGATRGRVARCRSRGRRRPSPRRAGRTAPQVEAAAEQLLAQPVPLPGRRGEELARAALALGQDAGQAVRVLLRRHAAGDFRPHAGPRAGAAAGARPAGASR